MGLAAVDFEKEIRGLLLQFIYILFIQFLKHFFFYLDLQNQVKECVLCRENGHEKQINSIYVLVIFDYDSISLKIVLFENRFGRTGPRTQTAAPF